MGRLLSVISKYENEIEAEIAALQEQNKALKQELDQQSRLLQKSTKLAEKHTFALGCCLKQLQQLGLTNKELNALTFDTLSLQDGDEV